MSDDKPVLILTGGINGAGKTTLYYEQIKPCLDKSGRNYPFVNADEMEKTKFPNEVGKHSIEMVNWPRQFVTNIWRLVNLL